LPIGRKPILEHIIDRCRSTRSIDEIIIASPADGLQGELHSFAKTQGVKWVEGDKNDLPKRLWQTAQAARNDRLILLTGDLPFVSWEGIDQLVSGVNGSYDYGNNIDGRSPYLDGTNCELVTAKGAERQAREATFGREHALIWLRQAEWEKKATVDAPFECREVAHLPVMVDDWGSYYADMFIHTMLQGNTSYSALLWCMRKYKADIERILVKG
jgi:spore coat polysaccharide biosynthesis protein SpsF (cytidylyltransferase family)